MKMSRSSSKMKEVEDGNESMSGSSVDSDEEDEDNAEREETPDLYRNSALGMYGGVSISIGYPHIQLSCSTIIGNG